MAFSVSSTNFDFSSSLSPSEKIDAAKYFTGGNAPTSTLWDKAENLNLSIEDTYGPNAPDFAGLIGLDSSLFLGGLVPASGPGWTFITAPENISWDVANSAQRVDIFGTNSPPVVAGSRGMRDLRLTNSLVEGFVRNVSVEGKVAALEQLMNYGLNPSDGFVSVPVYQVWANNKSYGGSEAYYIIKDISVKEAMRDIQGNATRAYVDVSLMQVPAYQVNSGRDQASVATAGARSKFPDKLDAKSQGNQGVAGSAANGGSTDANSKPSDGPGAGGKATPSTTPKADPTQLNQEQTIRGF